MPGTPPPPTAPTAAVLDKVANTPPDQRTHQLNSAMIQVGSNIRNDLDGVNVTIGESGVAVGGWVIAPPPEGTILPPGHEAPFAIIQYIYRPNNGSVSFSTAVEDVQFNAHVTGWFFWSPDSGQCYKINQGEFNCWETSGGGPNWFNFIVTK